MCKRVNDIGLESNLDLCEVDFSKFKKLFILCSSNKDKSLSDFSEYLINEGIGFYDYIFCMIVFGKINKQTRLNVWDTIFSTIPSTSNKFILDSYYDDTTSYSTEGDLIKHCLYVYWHDITVTKALYHIKRRLPEDSIFSYDMVYPVISVTLGIHSSKEGTLSTDYISDMHSWFDRYITTLSNVHINNNDSWYILC